MSTFVSADFKVLLTYTKNDSGSLDLTSYGLGGCASSIFLGTK